MSMRSLKFWLAVLLLTIVFLGVGRIFDRKCRGGCLRELVLLNFDDSTFIFGDRDNPRRKGGKLRISEAKIVDLPEVSATLEKVTIKSYVTNWVIRQGNSGFSIQFSGYRAPEEWNIRNEETGVWIETKKRGPQRAQLELPAGFAGDLELINVSGEVTFEGVSHLKRLKITNVSGLVTMQDLPREFLELSTVTGSIQASQNHAAEPLGIEVQSVSGDVDLRLKSDFARMHVESVSGSVFLRVPESCSFGYRLESISGNFSGFPVDAEESREFGEKNLEGRIGEAGDRLLHFETISGEFQLMQDKNAL